MALSKPLTNSLKEMDAKRRQLHGLISAIADNNRRLVEQHANTLAERLERTSLTSLEEAKSFKPLLLFPQEIWDKILKSITISADLLRLHHTCALFRIIVHYNRPGYLFSEVFLILQPYLPEEAIIACRLVSTTWKLAVDANLQGQLSPPPFQRQQHEEEILFNPLRSMHALRESITFRNTYECYQQPTRFLVAMMNHESRHNPFITRTLCFVICTNTVLSVVCDNLARHVPCLQARERVFWRNVSLILQKYGHHLASIKVQISNDCRYTDAINLSAFLYRIIPRTTRNLKILRVSGYLPSPPRMLSRDHFQCMPSVHTVEVDLNEVQAHLSMQGFFQGIVTQIHPSRIACMSRLLLTSKAWEMCKLHSLNWSRLRELYPVDIDEGVFDKRLLTCAKIPSLQKLGLRPRRENDSSAGIPFQMLIEIINVLSSKTKLYSIQLFNGFPFEELKSVIAMPQPLRKITALHLRGNKNDTECLDRFSFISAFPFLEQLQIGSIDTVEFVNAEQMRNNNSITDFLDLEKLISGKIEANAACVWKFLPRLFKIIVNEKIYKRIN